MRECVAAFIVKDKKVLLGKRSATRRFYPGVWDAFGGHQNPGESPEDALRRELLEELGIVPTELKFLLTVDEPNPSENGNGEYHFYLITAFDGEPQNLQPDEHAFIEWYAAEQTINLKFAHPIYYAVLDGILSSDGEPRPPAPKRIQAIADLFIRTVSVDKDDK